MEGRLHQKTGFWYLDPKIETTTNIPTGKMIIGNNDRGWTKKIGRIKIGVFYRAVRLKRVSETPAEGKFTCYIPTDINNNKSLLILYTSECTSYSHPKLHLSSGIMLFQSSQ